MHKDGQIPIINNLRGIAALSVCLFHFIYSTINYVKDQLVLDIVYYGQFGVALFFVISGIVIPLSLIRSDYTLKNWPRFFLKRVVRIEPPYLVALALAIVILLGRKLILNAPNFDISATQVALHLGYLIPFFEKYTWLNSVFWTLAIEFQYYLAISLLILLVTKGKNFGRLAFYIIMLMAPFYFTDTNFFPPYSTLFLVGICWSFYYLEKIRTTEFLIVLFLSSLVVYFKLGRLEAVIGVIAVLTVQFLNSYSSKTLNFFGNISYSLYLLHPLVGATIINILTHSFFLSWQKPFVILIGLLATILSSYIMYIFIEKPTQLLSKRLTYK